MTTILVKAFVLLFILHWVGSDILSNTKHPTDSYTIRFTVLEDMSFQETQRADPSVRVLFEKVANGISAGNISEFSAEFSRQIFVSVRGKESGYFSSNQAMLVLQNYFSSRRVVNFKFTTENILNDTPYATGGGAFMVRGALETFQVYVAIAKSGSRWVITQFNVY